MKITKEILQAKVDNINSKLGLTGVGSLVLDFAYSGVRLNKITNEGGGTSDITERLSIKEMAYCLDTLYNSLYKLNLVIK